MGSKIPAGRFYDEWWGGVFPSSQHGLSGLVKNGSNFFCILGRVASRISYPWILCDLVVFCH